MKTQRTLLLSAVVLAAAAGLSACGGGGDGNGFFPIATTPTTATTSPPTQPSAASDPFDVFLAYLKDLVHKVLDTSEPADVRQFDPPPTSETREPIALP